MYKNFSTPVSKRRSANYRWWRTVHLMTGFLAALWLLAVSATGVLINHQESLGLTEMDVSNRYLPSHYRDEFHPEATRLNVVLADLHSGRFFGPRGNLIGDAVAFMIFLSIGTGVYSFFLRRSTNSTQQSENGHSAGGEGELAEQRTARPPVKQELEVGNKTNVLASFESKASQKRVVDKTSTITGEHAIL